MHTFMMVSTARSTHYTEVALESFFRCTPKETISSLYVIDNDRALPPDFAERHGPLARLLVNESPKSFAANSNLVMRLAAKEGTDLVLLNNDLVFTKDWLGPVAAKQNALTVPVCNMQFPHRTSRLECKLAMSLEDYKGREGDLEELAARHRTSYTGFRLTHSVPFYCVRIPRAVYAEIGEFDETFGAAGWEDVDFILRCYLAGIPLYFALSSFILHFYGKSTWRTDSTGRSGEDLNIMPQDKSEQRRFEAKWGAELTQLFGYQQAGAMARFKDFEEGAIIRAYGEYIRAKRGS